MVRWTDPLATAMLERLASFSRVILFDKPGTVLSDPIPAAPTIEQRTADLVAVLDDVSAERAVVVGYSEGGLPAMVLAATQTHRVRPKFPDAAWVSSSYGRMRDDGPHVWLGGEAQAQMHGAAGRRDALSRLGDVG